MAGKNNNNRRVINWWADDDEAASASQPASNGPGENHGSNPSGARGDSNSNRGSSTERGEARGGRGNHNSGHGGFHNGHGHSRGNGRARGRGHSQRQQRSGNDRSVDHDSQSQSNFGGRNTSANATESVPNAAAPSAPYTQPRQPQDTQLASMILNISPIMAPIPVVQRFNDNIDYSDDENDTAMGGTERIPPPVEEEER